MVDIPMKSAGPVDKSSVLSINQLKVQTIKDRTTILELNKQNAFSPPTNNAINNSNYQNNQQMAPSSTSSGQHGIEPVKIKEITVPNLSKLVQKGQKVPLDGIDLAKKANVCLGWNVKNPQCDVDVSAFMLSGGKVISDDWFVFYGHPNSPDGSIELSSVDGADREVIKIDFSKLNGTVEKIVFVLTINEALQKRLNFSMIKDAYIRIMNGQNNSEIVSFLMDEYYDNVTSMMIGEIYKHNNAWKFNAIGNGVARDLAGLCELYGVQVD